MHNNAIPLIHITSPARALSIIRSGRFIPANSSPRGGDSGLNARIDGHPFNFHQEIAARGAELLLEWQGEIRPPTRHFPRLPNYLYEEEVRAWRVFVPMGTTRFLHITGVRVDDEREWFGLIDPVPWRFLSEKAKQQWRDREVHRLRLSIRGRLKERPLLCVG